MFGLFERYRKILQNDCYLLRNTYQYCDSVMQTIRLPFTSILSLLIQIIIK